MKMEQTENCPPVVAEDDSTVCGQGRASVLGSVPEDEAVQKAVVEGGEIVFLHAQKVVQLRGV